MLFDVDIGQKVEHIYPPNALSTEEQTDVAFCSFPVRRGVEGTGSMGLHILRCTHAVCKHTQDSLSMELHSVNRIKDRYFGVQ